MSRVQRGLDPFPTKAQVEAKLAERLPKRPDVATVTREVRKRAHEVPNITVVLPVLALHQRYGDTLRLVLNGPPRTKKNGTTLGIRQSPAYRRYRDAIISALAGMRHGYGSPILPDQAYNCEAVFYVDKKGERADLVGLLQGFCDALENAGVVSNDWYFRRFDGTRVVIGDSIPRVEVEITPLITGT